MARTRLDLQNLLESVLGSRNVYYQPPASVYLKYPAIIYQIDDIDNIHADNEHYLQHHRYSITVIDEDPDSKVSESISRLQMCSFNRFFVADNLNHFVYTIFF